MKGKVTLKDYLETKDIYQDSENRNVGFMPVSYYSYA